MSSYLYRLNVVLAAAVLAGLAGPARAQTPAVPKMEFDEAVRNALANNPTVAQAATAITHADLLVRQARAAILPTIGAKATNTTLNSAYGFDGLITQPQNQSSFGADFTVPILNLSQRASVGQARDQVDVAKLATDQTRREIAIATAQAYLGVIAAHRQLDVDARAVDNAHAHLDYAQRRLDAGGGSRLNQVRAAGSASTSELQLENSKLALQRAQEALGVLVAANSPIDAGADPVLETPATITEQDWMQTRPDVRVDVATQQAAERVVRDSWRDWVGTAAATFAPQYVAPAGLFQPARTWALALSFTQPVFDGGQRRATTALRELQVEQSKLALSSVLLMARSEVRISQAAVQSAQRALDTARLAATQADDVLRITTTAFQLGATTNIEVIDAQRSARDAESTSALAEDALRRAQLDLLVAIGHFPR